jgi:WXXGXW repeat (2 copies)
MTRLLRIGAISALLLAAAATAHAQISFDVHIGAPPPPHAYHVPPQPGPGYVWVEGYQYPQGSHYQWHDGYWTRPPYQGAYWVAPYHTNGQYFAGRWEGSHGNVAHDHRWDHGNERDYHRNPHQTERHDNRH